METCKKIQVKNERVKELSVLRELYRSVIEEDLINVQLRYVPFHY
jgi:hypothetical protein